MDKNPEYTVMPTVTGSENGYPIYSYGQFDVYGVNPTYFDALQIQKSNVNPFKKIEPKKSWEIKSNLIGITPTRLPSSRAGEVEPFHPLHLIDGNPATQGFAGRPQGDPEITHAWVRIDLPRTTKIKSVSLLPRSGNAGYPSDLTVRVSRWELWPQQNEWQVVYHAKDNKSVPMPAVRNTAPAVYEPVRETGSRGGWITYGFEPVDAREVWITSPDDFYLSEIEVKDADGNNVALVSKGAGISVSKGAYLYWLSENTQREMWPLNYDLGIKWLRVSYYLSPLIWTFVECEKGKYKIDPYTDQIVTEASKHGIEVCLTLGPNQNSLYKTEEEQVEAFTKYVRFMVNHFKGRVRYFEILNEYYNQDSFGPGKSGPYERVADTYVKFAIPAAKAIKQEYPQAKVILVGPCPLAVDFIETALKKGMAPLVDVITWHPYSFRKDTDGWYEPEELDRPRSPWAGPEIKTYDDSVRYLKTVASKYGFKGEFQANETGAYAIHQNRTTALISAKLMARSLTLHTYLNVPVFWNETTSLMRPAWQPFWDPAEPVMKPDYSYYVMRTLCTLLDSVKPVSAGFSIKCSDDRIEKCAFKCPNGDMLISFWIREKSRGLGIDDYPAKEADVFIPGIKADKAVGYELLNGQEQALNVSSDDKGTHIQGLLVRDYPLIIRIGKL